MTYKTFVFAAVGLLAAGCSDGNEDIDATVVLAAALAESPGNFERVTESRPLIFPEDHGAHPAYKLEWWYFTGNLSAPRRDFGYQMTLFRIALDGQASRESDSDWTSNQLYMGHVALTDAESQTFHAVERFSRNGAGLAGTSVRPFEVWLEDWSIRGPDPETGLRLLAKTAKFSIDLDVKATKPVVLHGDAGFSAKGPGVGQASMYYSYTRLATIGTINIEGESLDVEGTSWMDHEWSTSMLDSTQTGWDWFSLQLSDQSEIMLFQIRTRAGDAPTTSGTVIRKDGSTTSLFAPDASITVKETWTSPSTGATYPARWVLDIPSEEIELDVRPVVADQELTVSVAYWEGAVSVSGTSGSALVTGVGYVEMTGYADRPFGS